MLTFWVFNFIFWLFSNIRWKQVIYLEKVRHKHITITSTLFLLVLPQASILLHIRHFSFHFLFQICVMLQKINQSFECFLYITLFWLNSIVCEWISWMILLFKCIFFFVQVIIFFKNPHPRSIQTGQPSISSKCRWHYKAYVYKYKYIMSIFLYIP